jgi:hypothetical protein
MEQAQQEFGTAPNVYQGIMEFTNSILISFIVYFMGTFSTALYAAIGAC